MYLPEIMYFLSDVYQQFVIISRCVWLIYIFDNGNDQVLSLVDVIVRVFHSATGGDAFPEFVMDDVDATISAYVFCS